MPIVKATRQARDPVARKEKFVRSVRWRGVRRGREEVKIVLLLLRSGREEEERGEKKGGGVGGGSIEWWRGRAWREKRCFWSEWGLAGRRDGSWAGVEITFWIDSAGLLPDVL